MRRLTGLRRHVNYGKYICRQCQLLIFFRWNLHGVLYTFPRVLEYFAVCSYI